MRVDKRVQFSEPGDESVGTDGHIAVEEPAPRIGLDEPGHDHDAVLAAIASRARTEDRPAPARPPRQLGAVEMLQKRVPADRALVEADDLGPLLHGPLGQLVDPGQVVRLVVVAMLELGGGDSDVSHERFLICMSSRVYSGFVLGRKPPH